MNTPRPRLDPAVAATRLAVRTLLSRARDEGLLHPGDLVTVALSGGADSLALAAATAFEAPKHDLRAGAVVVDHALQAGSEAVASRASRTAASLGLDPVTVRRVAVGSDGGPEGAAREARHTAIAQVAADTGSPLVLFGHTLDDQAETVLLGLLRGSGPDALSGMPPLVRRTAGPAYGRPLLGVRRHTTRQATVAAGLVPWDDPQNDDPAYARVRVRTALMPVLERELGAGVPRRSPARPSSSARTPRRSTTSPRRWRRTSPSTPRRASRCPCPSCRRTRRRSGSDSCGWPSRGSSG